MKIKLYRMRDPYCPRYRIARMPGRGFWVIWAWPVFIMLTGVPRLPRFHMPKISVSYNRSSSWWRRERMVDSSFIWLGPLFIMIDRSQGE